MKHELFSCTAIVEALKRRVQLSVVIGTPVTPGGEVVGGLLHTAAVLSEASPRAATKVGDLALFAGGYKAVGTRGDRVDFFDGATGRWSSVRVAGADKSVAAAKAGDRAVFAGSDGVARLYDATTKQWSMARLSQARQGMIAVTTGDRAILAGGDTSSGKSDAVDIYDARTGSWSTAKLSRPEDSADVVVATLGEKILLANYDKVDIFNANTGRWSSAPLSQGRSRVAATTVGHFALFAGGLADPAGNGNITPSDAVDVYNARTGHWSRATLSQARSGIAAVTVGELAIFAGGNGFPSTVDIFDADTGRWSTSSPPPLVSFMSAASAGGRAVFVGGVGAAPGVVGDAEIFDIRNGQWSTTRLSERRTGMVTLNVGSTTLFAGGNTGPTAPRRSNVVDLFTAIPALGGTVSPGAGGVASVTVTIINSGDADLSAPYRLNLYASTRHTLHHGSLLVGTVRLRHALGVGASLRLGVPLALPPGSAAGQYHLIAVAGGAGGVGQGPRAFASQVVTLAAGGPAPAAAAVGSHAAASPTPAPAAPPAVRGAGPFHAGRGTDSLWGGDATAVLSEG